MASRSAALDPSSLANPRMRPPRVIIVSRWLQWPLGRAAGASTDH
jgi:hypothetical protein